MWKRIVTVLCLLAMVAFGVAGCKSRESSAQEQGEDKGDGQEKVETVPREFENDAARTSYAYGRMQGEYLQQQGMSFKALHWGIKDVEAEEDLRLTPAQISEAMAALRNEDVPEEPAELKLDEEGQPVLETPVQKLSYVWGTRFAQALKDQETMLQLPQMLEGMEDSYEGEPRALTDEQRKEAVQPLLDEAKKQEEEARQKKEEEWKELGEKNLKEGREFLAENKEAEGVKTTESGLQYKVLEEGDGESPRATDKVRVHYTGKFLDGEVFDSSHQRNKPAEFKLNEVIPGWTEGLQLMEEGAKYRFWIPSELAYKGGQPGRMPPNAVLDFEVELLKVLEGEQNADEGQ
jgi:FKBP-type peptidyl-prolyl cis-trans isomerase FklB